MGQATDVAGGAGLGGARRLSFIGGLGRAMMSRVVGCGCAALCVALLGFAVWASRHGDMGFSLIALALAFALLLASLALLRVRENRL